VTTQLFTAAKDLCWVDVSNVSFESIKCWQLEHELIYFWVFILVCECTAYSQNLWILPFRQATWNTCLGIRRGASIFVRTTSYLNHLSEKDKFKPHALAFLHVIFLHALSEQLSKQYISFSQDWKLIGDLISSYSLKCVWTIEVVTACFCPNGISCSDLSSITLLLTFQRSTSSVKYPHSVQAHGFCNLSLFDPLILIMLSGGQKEKCSITLSVGTTYVLDYIKLT
jgi:hypothetical protein